MSKFLIFFISIIAYSSQLFADTTTVYGTVSSYANLQLQLGYERDPITGEKAVLARTQADSSGKFLFKFDINHIYYAFLAEGKLRGFIFLVPGKNYEITLPKFQAKDTADIINPYFEPYEYYIKLLNGKPRGLNASIHDFDNQFTRFLNRHYQLISLQGSRARFDTIKTYFANRYLTVRSNFFKNYMQYSIKSLQATTLTQAPKKIFTELLDEDATNFQNPAFHDFFEQICGNYFNYFKNDSAFVQAVNSSNAKKCLQIINNKGWLKKQKLQNYAFIKGLYDAFYNHSFAKDTLISLLTNYMELSPDEDFHFSATQMYILFTQLKIGNPAPDFELYDKDSNITYLSDFKGYYVYLNFSSSQSFACVQQYGLINGVNEKYLDSLKIITIAADANFIKTRDYFRKNHFRWTLLNFANQPDILKKYAIKAYPTYYLLDPEGRFLWVPAPTPNEDFAYKYYLMIKEIKRKEWLKQGRDENGDYFKQK